MMTSLSTEHSLQMYYFFNMSSKFAQIFVLNLFFQQTSECPMLRMMLAAVHATEERMIASLYMTKIFALAFSYTKYELFASKSLVALYWMHLRVNLICIYFFAYKSTITAHCSLRDNFSGNVAIFNVYK